jgi:lipoprotein-anchoring transpeptidase ErfK/SrfK
VKVLESDVVTGAPYMATPTGTFSVLYKTSPTVLVGPGYAAPVTFWMPFTSSGVGFHDANWQPWFGGNRYTFAGSHGCVNMPYDAAAKLYSVLSPGDTVNVHY